MAHYIFFWLAFPITIAATFAFGGKSERWAALVLFLGVAVSMTAIHPSPRRYETIEWGVVVADALTLAGFLAIALRSSRFWPLWLSALQLLQLLSHFVAAPTGVIRLAYAMATSLLVYPMMLLLLAATCRHRMRARRSRSARS